MTNQNIIDAIEATSLKFDTDMISFVDKVKKYGFTNICLLPNRLSDPIIYSLYSKNSPVNKITVFNFPFGYSSTESVCNDINYYFSYYNACDIVLPPLNYERTNCEFLTKIEQTIYNKDQYIKYHSKIIVENLLLDSNDYNFRATLCHIINLGFGYIKTHTGLGPRGVNTDDIKRIRDVVGDSIKIKASGGIRNLYDLMKLKEAGADVFGIGIDAACSIVEELGVKPCEK